MRLIVIDFDSVKGLSGWQKKKLNEKKVCSLLKNDFGKKTLLSLPNNDPEVLRAYKTYSNAIFHIKDDDKCLKHETKMFQKLIKKIRWFRIGIILRREKAVKILLKLVEGK